MEVKRTQAQMPDRIKEWFNRRGITPEILKARNIYWNGREIVIPIYDSNSKHLFNKYRRDPHSNTNTGPKYKYDKGATTALYGIHSSVIEHTYKIIICEGELDALRLQSMGFIAVASTGGSGSFPKDWKMVFHNKETIICFDYDEAGIKGAYNVQAKIPWAKIAWLPKKDMDITDFLLENSIEDLNKIFDNAKIYDIPPKEGEHGTKKEIDFYINEFKTDIYSMMLEARELRTVYKNDDHIEILKGYYLKRIEDLRRMRKYLGKPKIKIDGTRIEKAKSVPINHYVQFDSNGFANCIWHKEKTPSMFYYRDQNRVKCFGCDKMGDVIDVVQCLQGVGLQEALSIILGEK